MGHSARHDVGPTFYRGRADAISAPPEQLACRSAFAHQDRLQGGDASSDSYCYR